MRQNALIPNIFTKQTIERSLHQCDDSIGDHIRHPLLWNVVHDTVFRLPTPLGTITSGYVDDTQVVVEGDTVEPVQNRVNSRQRRPRLAAASGIGRWSRRVRLDNGWTARTGRWRFTSPGSWRGTTASTGSSACSVLSVGCFHWRARWWGGRRVPHTRGSLRSGRPWSGASRPGYRSLRVGSAGAGFFSPLESGGSVHGGRDDHPGRSRVNEAVLAMAPTWHKRRRALGTDCDCESRLFFGFLLQLNLFHLNFLMRMWIHEFYPFYLSFFRFILHSNSYNNFLVRRLFSS